MVGGRKKNLRWVKKGGRFSEENFQAAFCFAKKKLLAFFRWLTKSEATEGGLCGW